jgi:pyruvate ferredoxin oxidoreductase beta subunit
MYNFKEVMSRPERLTGGHRMCAGCGSTVAVRGVLRALRPEDRAVITCATGCLEVSSFMYPYTAWKDSFIHSAFENAGATVSGVEAAYNVLRKKKKLDEGYKFIVFGGDGGTYDIGFQSLSGAFERGHDLVYVCYDNNAYMNTGVQRSSATPMYADTTTTPVGKESRGKPQFRKEIAEIMAAHNIPYVAQTTFKGNFRDLHEKSQKAIYKKGPAFLNVLSPCPRGWRYEPSDLMEICNLAVETCFWPLFEVEDGEWTLTYKPKNKLHVEAYLKTQGRFAHLFKKGNEHLIEEIQNEVDRRWDILLVRCGDTNEVQRKLKVYQRRCIG